MVLPSREGVSNRRRIQYAVWLSGVMFGLASGLWCEPDLHAQQSKEPSQTPPAKSEPASVVAKMWVDANVVSSSDHAQLWITIENGLASPINLQFDDFVTPGFSHGPRCWSVDGRFPTCLAGGTTANASNLKVEANNTLTLRGEITRNAEEMENGGRVIVTGSLHWLRDDPARATKTGDSAHPTNVTVATASIDLSPTLWFKTPRAVLITESLVPIVLSVLGGIVAFMTYRYQQQRTERHAIWTEMMGKVTRDAEQHLLPLSSAAATFVEAVKDWHKSRTAENKSELTFRLVMLNFRISYMADAIGGFYFRLRSAETLASACWHAYRARQHSVLNKQDPLERVLQFMGPKTTGGAFATKRTGVWKGSVGFQNDVNDVESTLAAFVDRPNFPLYELELLRVFQRVIDVEVDRAFSRWYGQEPRVDRQDLRNVRRTLRSQPPEILGTDSHNQLVEALNLYLLDTARGSVVRRPAAKLWWRLRAIWKRWGDWLGLNDAAVPDRLPAPDAPSISPALPDSDQTKSQPDVKNAGNDAC